MNFRRIKHATGGAINCEKEYRRARRPAKTLMLQRSAAPWKEITQA
jgi:hypothetical protein